MRRETRKFAILEHHWNGIHWDFLVEDGPSLRTWTIDEPLIAGHELAARALAPHRWIYLDYEGEISGGRGWVKRWDSGTCEVLDWEDSLVRLRVAGSQIAGEVVFRSSVFNEVRRWVFCFGKLS
jgi:hypothetical protein